MFKFFLYYIIEYVQKQQMKWENELLALDLNEC